MEKSVFISPFVDRGFKILFGQENSKVLLIDLLNDLLDGERHIGNDRREDRRFRPSLQGQGR